MPHISEMIPAKYLRREDLESFKNKQALVTVAKLTHANVAKEDEEPRYRWLVKFTEFPAPLVLNSTNIQALADIFDSKQSDDWIGKKCVVFFDPGVTMKGQRVGGLRVRAPKGGTVPPAPPAPEAHAYVPEGPEELEDDIPF